MFWTNYVRLCNERGISPNKAARECGIKASGTVTGWKNGSLPRQNVLKKLADYFGCTVSDLLGNEKNPATQSDGTQSSDLGINFAVISEKDVRFLNWFRSLPQEKQKAILVSQDAPKDLL